MRKCETPSPKLKPFPVSLECAKLVDIVHPQSVCQDVHAIQTGVKRNKMITFPTDPKAIRSRISSYKSALRKEKKTYGAISDGAGKRMTLFWLHFMLDDHDASATYFDWYQTEFPDDMGEPIQHLCWALTLLRMGKEEEARSRLAIAMLSNLYLIPVAMGRRVEKLKSRQASNFQELEYIEECPEELFAGISAEDRGWMNLQYDSPEFERIREKYRELDTVLTELEVGPKRSKLVTELFALLRDPLRCA